jgi:hypothetical protein
VRPPPAPPLDVEALLETLLSDCRSLREALPAGQLPQRGWEASPPLARACAAVAAGSAALRGLVAGHFGVSHWSPSAAHGRRASLFAADAGGRETPTSGAVAVWISVAADADELLAAAAYPGYTRTPPPEAPSHNEPASAVAASVRALVDELGPSPPPPPPSAAQLPPHLAGAGAGGAVQPSAPEPCWVDILVPAADPFAQLAPPELAGPGSASSVRVPMSALRPLSTAARAAAAAGQPLQPGSAGSAACSCALCFERPVQSALLECGHAVCCERCAAALVTAGLPCPVCRAPIARVVRVFL